MRAPRVYLALSTTSAIKGAEQFRKPHEPTPYHERTSAPAVSALADYGGSYLSRTYAHVTFALPREYPVFHLHTRKSRGNAKETNTYVYLFRDENWNADGACGAISIRKR